MSSKSKMYCSVPQCHNYLSKTISMHRFPPDKKLVEKWQIALKIGKPISKFMYVCSEHFLAADYIKSSNPNPQKKQLKKGTIPSQKIPGVSHETVSGKSRSTRTELPVEVIHIEQMHVEDDAVFQTSTSGTSLIENKP